MSDAAAYWDRHDQNLRAASVGRAVRVDGEPFYVDGVAVSGPKGTPSYEAELTRRVAAGLPLEPIFSPGGSHGSHATQTAASASAPVLPAIPAGGARPGSRDATTGAAASWEASALRVFGPRQGPHAGTQLPPASHNPNRVDASWEDSIRRVCGNPREQPK